MNPALRNMYQTVLDLARAGGEGVVAPRLCRRAEAARRRGLLRRGTRARGARQHVYRLTAKGWAWLPGAMYDANDLRVEVAAAIARDTCPAVTFELLALLKVLDFVWQPRGIYERKNIGHPADLRYPGAMAVHLIPWRVRFSGSAVWWLGNSPDAVTIDEQAFWALRRAEAMPNGDARLGGKVVRLVVRKNGMLSRSNEAILWDVEGRCPLVL